MGNLRASLLAFTALLASCSSSPTGEDDECYLPLGSYCSGSRCPSYDQSLVELRQFGADPSCFVAASGRCGDVRFTRSGLWFGNTTLYFDESGAVIAAHTTTDAGDGRSACGFWKHYGRRVSCELAVQEDYCRR
jgi:hypothetical protein